MVVVLLLLVELLGIQNHQNHIKHIPCCFSCWACQGIPRRRKRSSSVSLGAHWSPVRLGTGRAIWAAWNVDTPFEVLYPWRIHGAAIYGNIYHQYTPNVSIYTIHGYYGIQVLEGNVVICWYSLMSSMCCKNNLVTWTFNRFQVPGHHRPGIPAEAVGTWHGCLCCQLETQQRRWFRSRFNGAISRSFGATWHNLMSRFKSSHLGQSHENRNDIEIIHTYIYI